MVRIKNIYQVVEAEDGFRLLVMRKWPRGIPKEAVDAWDKELGPSLPLLEAWRQQQIDWAGFSREYIQQMQGHQEKLRALAHRAQRETVTLLCSCREEEHCHRSLLKRLIEEQSPPDSATKEIPV